MSDDRTAGIPLRDGHAGRYQVAAIPARVTEDGSMEVLLVTSRETRRWIAPKGWTMKGISDNRAAEIEAREEAGIRGSAFAFPIGAYSYWKLSSTASRLTRVHVYVMRVERELRSWKEKDQRERRWFEAAEAAECVSELELKSLLKCLPFDESVRRFVST